MASLVRWPYLPAVIYKAFKRQVSLLSATSTVNVKEPTHLPSLSVRSRGIPPSLDVIDISNSSSLSRIPRAAIPADWSSGFADCAPGHVLRDLFRFPNALRTISIKELYTHGLAMISVRLIADNVKFRQSVEQCAAVQVSIA